MTEPTDAEIRGLAATGNGVYQDDETAIWEITDPSLLKFARAVLAKWGTPAPVVVGEVAEHYRNAIASACEGWTMPDGLRKHLETALWSPPTPQPTQSQAGAVPLTCEWTHDENDGFWESACGEAWQFNDGGPADNNVRFCQGCGKPLGIKGGQHDR